MLPSDEDQQIAIVHVEIGDSSTQPLVDCKRVDSVVHLQERIASEYLTGSKPFGRSQTPHLRALMTSQLVRRDPVQPGTLGASARVVRVIALDRDPKDIRRKVQRQLTPDPSRQYP